MSYVSLFRSLLAFSFALITEFPTSRSHLILCCCCCCWCFFISLYACVRLLTRFHFVALPVHGTTPLHSRAPHTILYENNFLWTNWEVNNNNNKTTTAAAAAITTITTTTTHSVYSAKHVFYVCHLSRHSSHQAASTFCAFFPTSRYTFMCV